MYREVRIMDALIIMTRIPIPGQTKTRLMDIMTGTECADLHMAFLKDLVAEFAELMEDIDIYLTYTPDHSLHILDPIIPNYIRTFPQIGEDLGERMHNAIKKVLLKGYRKVILIGSDIPDIKAKDISSAFTILDDHDIVFGPSYDGGYYLVGMKEPNDTIFHINKKWGGKSVLESTIDKGNNQSLSIGLAEKYRDIDTKEDLFDFMKRYEKGTVAINTMQYMKVWRTSGQWKKTN